MSSVEMVSASAINFKVPYQILRHDGPLSDDERDERVSLRPKKWGRLRGVPLRRRLRVKVGSWRKVWMMKKVMLLCSKVKRRFKEGHGHFGDLFAGNYVFTQINPTSLKYLQNKLSQAKIV
ncbi:uncharacterized protein LOC114171264 [Vigna unguiculata]|uniref:Uncharacterized protein n=1 Tax=Vigna unguiculata TaxID=3917 RepID=A0A4D6LW77_VIGUN|nr:uncharacterized protein LOC114171264 [Vigna unguiculata]QCD93162.1 hypothetical protein DEO72_LG5g1234 [Vigna unguiculata]